MSELNLEVIACASKSCHAVMGLPVVVVERFRETGETFCCPFGHPMSFTNSSAKRIRDLREQVDDEIRTREAVEAEANRLRAQIKRLKRAKSNHRAKSA